MYYVIFSLNVTLFTILLLYNILLSCIKAANAIMYIHELPMFAYNVCLQCLPRIVMCSCAPYTIFSVVKLDLCIRALLLDHILALKKNTRTLRVHLVF